MQRPRSFAIADLHFGHFGVTMFQNKDNTGKLRPWTNPEAMTTDLVSFWNETVNPADKVYVLGDVAINRHSVGIISQCNGRKVLVKGNHDVFRLSEYVPNFEDIQSCAVYNDWILTHIPIHPCSVGRWRGNIHGHLHDSNVMVAGSGNFLIKDPRYKCVSVEQINYRPVLLNEIAI